MPNWCWTSYVAVGDKKIYATYTKDEIAGGQ